MSKCFKLKTLVVVSAMLLFRSIAVAQTPVEIFAGDKKATFDVMFFKFFKNKEKQNSKWLFFNRNRATIDYKMTKTSNFPQYGFTEGISYNHKNLKGFAPVLVAQLNNRGIYPKLGLQYAKVKPNFTIFSWLVVEVLKSPNVDYFLLGRYTPKISTKLKLFTQVELYNGIPTLESNSFTLIQRMRLGLKLEEYQFGLGLDFTAIGRNKYTNTQNIGLFLRSEF
jgi:hypothetical protein